PRMQSRQETVKCRFARKAERDGLGHRFRYSCPSALDVWGEELNDGTARERRLVREAEPLVDQRRNGKVGEEQPSDRLGRVRGGKSCLRGGQGHGRLCGYVRYAQPPGREFEAGWNVEREYSLPCAPPDQHRRVAMG